MIPLLAYARLPAIAGELPTWLGLVTVAPHLAHYLVLSAILLGAGITTILLKRNPLGILMGVELIVNAAALNLVAFHAFGPPPQSREVDAPIFTLLIIVIAAAQCVLALAIFLNFKQNFHRMDVERARTLRSPV